MPTRADRHLTIFVLIAFIFRLIGKSENVLDKCTILYLLSNLVQLIVCSVF